MNIPDKATEALRAHVRETCVVDQMGEDGADWYADRVLELVTPIIAAQALRDAAGVAVVGEDRIPWLQDDDRCAVASWLQRRADGQDPS